MRNKKFFDLNQAHRYLSDCIIRLGEEPIRIIKIDPGVTTKNFILTYSPVTKNEGNYIYSDNAEIDMNPFPLGWLSVNEKSGWRDSVVLSRTPLRDWKIGLNVKNLHIATVESWGYEVLPRAKDLLWSEQFLDTVKGNYLPLEKAIALSHKWNGKGIPFSRRFAVNGNNLHYYMYHEAIGEIKKDRPVLSENAFFLEEVLKEDLHA